MRNEKFIKVRCPKCKNEQVIFSTPVNPIPCLVCEKLLAQPTGGKADVAGHVLEVLE